MEQKREAVKRRLVETEQKLNLASIKIMFTDNKTEQNKAVQQNSNTKQKRINKINKQSK